MKRLYSNREVVVEPLRMLMEIESSVLCRCEVTSCQNPYCQSPGSTFLAWISSFHCSIGWLLSYLARCRLMVLQRTLELLGWRFSLASIPFLFPLCALHDKSIQRVDLQSDTRLGVNSNTFPLHQLFLSWSRVRGFEELLPPRSGRGTA